MRDKLIAAAFGLIRASRLDRLISPVTRGLGAILMFHHVRPAGPAGGFRPNGFLEITPEFLEAVVIALRRRGFDIISLDAAIARIGAPAGRRPFAVLSFDDGYRDNRDHALPILQRLGAPFIVYVTSGFAQRAARLWWRELEVAVVRAAAIDIKIGPQRLRLPASNADEKHSAFNTLYWRLRAGPEERLLAVIAELAERHGIDAPALVAQECLDFDEIAAIAREPLCTIGAHTLTHPMLAKHDAPIVRRELDDGRRQIAARIGRAVTHLAYPVGDRTSAGPREFAIARELGYASAVTTRPGMIFSAHAAHLTALPRLSINGRWQNLGYVEALLSGAPFALWNAGRRLNVA